HPPYGYRDNGSGWVPDEAEQRGVALMVELRGQGLSLRRIAAELERQGIQSRGGRRLSPQVVSNVLKRQVN
ncbi:MAG: recombinase family protein, partial [Planctomycetota bacterium]|nr:recombinase family protein [Planctomycetota bacterium]